LFFDGRNKQLASGAAILAVPHGTHKGQTMELLLCITHTLRVIKENKYDTFSFKKCAAIFAVPQGKRKGQNMDALLSYHTYITCNQGEEIKHSQLKEKRQ
jgi:hypothetical protein